ncbi:MAG: hypothetical protein GXO74_08630, partial [Calditrichaeota bacterium]|nr:hypothetical protein [Calditrichota bacterium]
INDFYKPFIKPNASEKHYVRVSVVVVIIIAILGGTISFFMNDIFLAWLLLSAINAGIGVVFIARWYWWRINAWSEISAMASVFVVVAATLLISSETLLREFLAGIVISAFSALIIFYLRKNLRWRRLPILVTVFAAMSLMLVLTVTLPEKKFPWTLIYSVPISLTVWLTVTLLTHPVEEAKLMNFYRLVHPGGPGWRVIAGKLKENYENESLWTKANLFSAIFAIASVVGSLLTIGSFVLQRTLPGTIALAGTIAAIYFSVHFFRKIRWETISPVAPD